MLENINEEYIRMVIKKEMDRYFSNDEDEKTLDDNLNEKLRFLGENLELKKELEKYFILNEDANILVVSDISIKNLFNFSNAIYENDFEKIVIDYLLKKRKVIFIEEGIEHLKYDDIPIKILDKYNKYLNKIKEYGVKIQKETYFLKHIISKEEIYTAKLLDLKKIIELAENTCKVIIVEKSTIITDSANDYAKENEIMIKRR